MQAVAPSPVPANGSTEGAPGIERVAVVSTHLPRKCGLATYAADLTEAVARAYPDIDLIGVALGNPAGVHSYSSLVRFEIAHDDRQSYLAAAAYLNEQAPDVVLVQHEYGIFGGEEGAYVLDLLAALRAPTVTTLHTVLEAPSSAQWEVLREVVGRSDRVVVMSTRGARLLQKGYGVPARTIDVIPHGIPDAPLQPPEPHKLRLGLAGRKVLLTFGLLNADKGIDYAIQALPAVVKRHPDALYVVLGETHPLVRRQHGEAYRESLTALAGRLGVSDHVRFVERFVSQDELLEHLAATDVYLTPYLNRDQATSGTLTYAVGMGRAVVSTDYGYAQEILRNGLGRVVPIGNAAALAQALNELLDRDDERLAMGARAYRASRHMTWPRVARQYMASFRRAVVPSGEAVWHEY